MIDFQSSAIVRSSSYRSCHSPPGAPAPGGERQGEGELCSRGRQSALIKVGRAYSRAADLKSFSVAEIRVYPCPSVVGKSVFAKRTHFSMQDSINQKDTPIDNLPIKANQGCSNLFKPRLHPPRSSGRVAPIIGYYRLMKPICALFQEKKDCLFFELASLVSPDACPDQPKSTPPGQKANQMQTDANQKRKSPLDSGCDGKAFRTETFNLEVTRDPQNIYPLAKSFRPILTNYNLFQPIIAPPPPTLSGTAILSILSTGGDHTLPAKSKPVGRVN
jgi:hypothetical protein